MAQSISIPEQSKERSPARARQDTDERKLSRNQRIVTHIVLIILSLIFILPFFWMFTGSIKTEVDLNALPVVWWPQTINLGNYVYGLQALPFTLYIFNTLVICFFSMIGAALSSSFVAYGVSRIDWPLRTPLFVIILGTTMVPFYVTVIPLFTLFRSMGWVNTYLPLIVPTFFGVPFYVFLLRQFFLTIPRDLSDAARIDGANELSIFFRIILPLAKPALAAVALFQFLTSWSDFLGPLIYLSNQSRYTVSLGLSFFQGQYSTEYGPMMAVSVILVLPVIVLFFFAQRTFIQGITLTGVKG